MVEIEIVLNDIERDTINTQYKVSGGCVLKPYIADTYDDGLKEFLSRIRITKPLTGCVIKFEKITYINDVIVDIMLIHRVTLV